MYLVLFQSQTYPILTLQQHRQQVERLTTFTLYCIFIQLFLYTEYEIVFMYDETALGLLLELSIVPEWRYQQYLDAQGMYIALFHCKGFPSL